MCHCDEVPSPPGLYCSPRARVDPSQEQNPRCSARPSRRGVLGTAMAGMLAVGEVSLSKFMRGRMPGRSIFGSNDGAGRACSSFSTTQPRAARLGPRKALASHRCSQTPTEVRDQHHYQRAETQTRMHPPRTAGWTRSLSNGLGSDSGAVASQCQIAGSGVIDGTSRSISEASRLNPIFTGVVSANADRQIASRSTGAYATVAA